MKKNRFKMKWTEADFDEIGWHDNYIHAMRLDAEKFRLHLDIDHILEWDASDSGCFRFWIAPATLTFHNVSDLRIAAEWGDSSLEMSVDRIERGPEKLSPNAKVSLYDWRMTLNWPQAGGEISFESSGFTQTLRADPILSDEQKLPPSKRGKAF